jgi:prolyl oligopeptidase
MKKYLGLSFIVVGLIFSSCNKPNEIASAGQYPVAKKVDTVDTYFGVQVADPYRWMENDTAQETADWVKAENDVTFGFLDKIPYRDKVKKRLEALTNYEKLGSPFREGEYVYFYKNSGLQNHYVLYRKKVIRGRQRFFLTQILFPKMELPS